MGLSSKQVSSDRNGWNQALLEGAGTLEFPKTSPTKKQQQQPEQQQQQQQQQQQPEQLKCPRCDSGNTKFCYYNNYNKSQPRHFCKACKRHWTKGGTLRNVPVGGGRKNKRPKTSKTASKTSNTSSTTTKTTYSGMRTNNNNMGSIHAQQQLRVSPPLGGALTLNSGVGVEDENFSEAFYQNFLMKQHHQQQLPQSSITFNSSKGLSDHHYQGVFMGSNPTTNLGLSSQHQHDQEMQFPYSNFESNPCSISSTITSIQSPNVYNFTGSDHANNSSSLSDSWAMHTTTSSTRNNTTTNNNISNDNNDHNNNSNNNLMEMSSNWGWDDFDKFVSVEADLSMPWDDADIN